MSGLSLLLIAGFWLALLLLLSLGERLVQSLSLRRIQQLQQRKPSRAVRQLQYLYQRMPNLLAALLLGRYICLCISLSLLVTLAYRELASCGLVLAGLFCPILMMLCAELIPRHLRLRRLEAMAIGLGPVLVVWMWLIQPLAWLLQQALQRFLLGYQREPVLSLLGNIQGRHRQLMSRFLELEQIRVNDIMVPRQDIEGLDLQQDWPQLLKRVAQCQHQRLVLYRGQIEQLEGVIWVKELLPYLVNGRLSPTRLLALSHEAYFIPSNTPLDIQLNKFRRQAESMGLVVDEYGDILGLLTCADILREMAGEKTELPGYQLQQQTDGSYLVDAAFPIRELNRRLTLQLPTDGARTLNGLILDHLEQLPEVGVCIRQAGCTLEVLVIKDNRVQQVRLNSEPGGQEISRTDWPIISLTDRD